MDTDIARLVTRCWKCHFRNKTAALLYQSHADATPRHSLASAAGRPGPLRPGPGFGHHWLAVGLVRLSLACTVCQLHLLPPTSRPHWPWPGWSCSHRPWLSFAPVARWAELLRGDGHQVPAGVQGGVRQALQQGQILLELFCLSQLTVVACKTVEAG